MKKLTAFVVTILMVLGITFSASAADFTPSVQGKEAPEIQSIVMKNGKKAFAVIKDSQGNELAGVDEKSIVITPVAKADTASADVSKALKAAYEQIKLAKSLKDIVPEIEQVVKSISSNLNADNFIVRDLFDISIDEQTKALLKDGNTITLRFKLDIAADDVVLCLHNIEGQKWEIISKDRVVNNGDGTVDVTFESLSPVAFAVEGADGSNDSTSEQTSEESSSSAEQAETQTPVKETSSATPIIIGAVAAVVVIGLVIIVLKKKKNK